MKHPYLSGLTRISFTAAAIAALAACASPVPSAELTQARARYNAASTDGQIRQHASEELRQANAALMTAEQAQADGVERPRVDHLAYLANQRLTLTQATADSRALQATTAAAGAERDRMRLAQRTREADAAQRQLQAAQAAGAQQDQALARSDAQLQAAQAASAQQGQALARSDAQVQALQAEMAALNAKPTERGAVMTLGDLHFNTGRSELQASGARGLVQLADFLKRHPDQNARIEGFTDNVGSEASNQDLSERRADAVMDALRQMGVDQRQLSAQGRGEGGALASNDSSAGRQTNRRVEVLITASR